ncbi:MAG: phenylalanine--tRNA ligase subunit alpha, partial [Planctomycetota bacterium]
MLEQFEKIGRQALTDLKKVADVDALEQFRIKYLSRKGQVTQMLSRIGQFSAEQKREAGQLANKVKKEVTQAYEDLKKTLQSRQVKPKELIDVTLPGKTIHIGKQHVITQVINEMLEIFGR